MRLALPRSLPLLGAVLWFAACSQGDPNGGAANKNTVAPAATTPSLTGAASSLAAKQETRGTRALTARVSGLAGDIGGLGTRVTDLGLVIDLPSDALFNYGKAELTPAAQAELRKAAELIRASSPGEIQIVGHTDSDGDDAINQTLSEKRARTVANWFSGQVGVRQRQFVVAGKGEAAPIAPNVRDDGKDDPAGRAKNRRVEVILPASNSG